MVIDFIHWSSFVAVGVQFFGLVFSSWFFEYRKHLRGAWVMKLLSLSLTHPAMWRWGREAANLVSVLLASSRLHDSYIKSLPRETFLTPQIFLPHCHLTVLLTVLIQLIKHPHAHACTHRHTSRPYFLTRYSLCKTECNTSPLETEQVLLSSKCILSENSRELQFGTCQRWQTTGKSQEQRRRVPFIEERRTLGEVVLIKSSLVENESSEWWCFSLAVVRAAWEEIFPPAALCQPSWASELSLQGFLIVFWVEFSGFIFTNLYYSVPCLFTKSFIVEIIPYPFLERILHWVRVP